MNNSDVMTRMAAFVSAEGTPRVTGRVAGILRSAGIPTRTPRDRYRIVCMGSWVVKVA
jgi:hypothetical protein